MTPHPPFNPHQIHKPTSNSAATLSYDRLQLMYSELWSMQIVLSTLTMKQKYMCCVLHIDLAVSETFHKLFSNMLVFHYLMLISEMSRMSLDGDILVSDLSSLAIYFPVEKTHGFNERQTVTNGKNHY